MRPNLSLEKIAGALAALGTGVLISACGGGDKPASSPVEATEVAPGEKAAGGEGSCGADKGEGSCGANKGEGSCGANKTDGEPTSAPETSSAETPAPAAAPADAPKKAPAKKKAGASACGAGTCAAKK
jgi:hypothetical protein